MRLNNTTAGASTQLIVNGRGLFTGGAHDPADSSGAGVEIGYDTGSAYGFISSIQTGVANKPLRIYGTDTLFYNSTSLIATINTVGLGIGMTPSNVLDVFQSVNTGAVASIKNTNAGTSAYARFLATNGTYSTILDMEGTAFSTTGVFRQNGTILYGDGPGGVTIDTGAAQPIYFGINNVEKMRLDASGNLGIGMTPARTLDVTGTFGVTGASTLGGALTYGGVTLANSVQGTGSMLLGGASTSWTVSDQSGAGLSIAYQSVRYSRVGNFVIVHGLIVYPATASGAGALLGTLPVTVPNQDYSSLSGAVYSDSTLVVGIELVLNTTTFKILKAGRVQATNAEMSSKTLSFMIMYPAA